MTRFTFCRTCLAPLLLFTFGVAMAQKPALELNTTELQRATEIEKRATATKDSVLLAEAYYRYGMTYDLSGDLLTSKTYYLKALRILEPRGDSFLLGRLFLRLSVNVKSQLYSDEEIRYMYRALAVFKRINSLKGLRMTYIALGQVYHRNWAAHIDATHGRTKFDSIYAFYRKAEQISYQTNDTIGIIEATAHIGILLTNRVDRQAIDYFKRALLLLKYKKNDTTKIYKLTDLGTSFGVFKQYPKGLHTLEEARKLYQQNHFNDYHLLTHLDGAFRDFYIRTGQWNLAYVHLQAMYNRENNQFLAERDGAITRLSVEYETDKKDAQLRAKNRELILQQEAVRNGQRFAWAMAALCGLAVFMCLIFFRLYSQKNRLSRRNAQLVREQNHRVKNNLQVVSSLLNLYAHRLTDPISKMAVEESQLRVETMALLQRQLYDRNKLTTIDLSAFIPDLVEGVLQTYGYDNLQPEYQLDECELPVDLALPVGLIINELTTNACKYAFARKKETPSCYFITCKRHKQKVELTISDNGPGLPKAFLSGSGEAAFPTDSFGLQLIQMQVEQLEGTSRFWSDKGTHFTMTFIIHT